MRKRSISQSNLYLSKVKQKQNRSWTEEQMLKIYTFRKNKERKISAQEIARKFNASVIQIYNIVRVIKKGLLGKCYICGGSVKGKTHRLIKACNGCKKKQQAYKKARRIAALKRGLCGYCEERPVIPGFKACDKCISSTQRRRYQKGLCGYCGKRPIFTDRLCKICSERIKIIVKIRRQQTLIEREMHV